MPLEHPAGQEAAAGHGTAADVNVRPEADQLLGAIADYVNQMLDLVGLGVEAAKLLTR